MRDERPVKTEREESDAGIHVGESQPWAEWRGGGEDVPLVARSGAEDVADPFGSASVGQANDAEGGEEGEDVGGNPGPTEDGGEHDPEAAIIELKLASIPGDTRSRAHGG